MISGYRLYENKATAIGNGKQNSQVAGHHIGMHPITDQFRQAAEESKIEEPQFINHPLHRDQRRRRQHHREKHNTNFQGFNPPYSRRPGCQAVKQPDTDKQTQRLNLAFFRQGGDEQGNHCHGD